MFGLPRLRSKQASKKLGIIVVDKIDHMPTFVVLVFGEYFHILKLRSLGTLL